MNGRLIPRDRLWPVLLFHHATELGQGDVLDLAHPFASDFEFASHVLERLRFVAIWAGAPWYSTAQPSENALLEFALRDVGVRRTY